MAQQQQPASGNNQVAYGIPQAIPVNYGYMPMPYYYTTMQTDQQQTQEQKTTKSLDNMEKRYKEQLELVKKHVDEQIQKYQKEQFEAEKRAWQAYGKSRGFI